jgi:zinc-ribbon domain
LANYCPYCGNKIIDTNTYCPSCGRDLRQFGSAPLAPVGPALEDLKKYSDLKARTDKIISPWWTAVPAASSAFIFALLGIAILGIESEISSIPSGSSTPPTAPFTGLVHSLEYVSLVSFVIQVLLLYLYYHLVSRRNQHFERQQRVLYDASYILRQTIVARSQLTAEKANDLARIDAGLGRMRARETPNSALLWVLLQLVPVVSIFAYFYIFYFLMRDFPQHEQEEDNISSILSFSLASLGSSSISMRAKSLHERSFILYLFLFFVTLGVFSIYWVYVLICDGNKHFQGDALIESQLVASLATLSSAPQP